MPKTGLFATLGGLLRAEGSGAPSSGAPARPGLRLGRRPILVPLFSACALICALALGAGSAAAATTEFGEEGEHAGQFSQPYGVAINQATGDVFVADQNNERIDSFGGSGSWLRAWGWDVNAESPVEALQTCTTVCQAGRSGASAGTYASGEGPHGVAVDSELGSLSYGDVYVADRANFRVQKFKADGEFILTFGSGVLTAGAGGTGTLTVPSSTCSEQCSKTITAVSTESRAFVAGQTITAANGGIPPGTTITSIGGQYGNIGLIELSRPATVAGSTKLTVAAGEGNVAVNEQQTVTIGGAPTGGTFTLFFTSPAPTPTQEQTAATGIAWDAPAASVQGALEALPNIGPGNVAVTGENGGPYTVEFTGTRYADTNVNQMQGSEEGLTGGTEPKVTVATTVEGHSAPADNVCSNAVDCVAGVQGEKEEGANASGQFNWNYRGPYIAVGPEGDVYVGDQARVQVFHETGAFKKEIPLEEPTLEEPTFPRYGKVSALAVDSTTGEMFVVEEYTNGVHRLNALGTEVGKFDMTSEGSSIKGVALDAKTGDLYVEDCTPNCRAIPHEPPSTYHFLKYDAKTGEELASFGSKTIQESFGGMAIANATEALYASGVNFQGLENRGEPRVFVFTPPPAGPLIEAGSESGTPEQHGAAKLKAEIIPEGHETTYRVEYITEEQFQADGETYGAGTKSEAGPSSITTELFEDHPVEVNLPEATLVPGVTYHWRLVAKNSQGTATSADNTLEETAPALIDGPWASEVTSTTATLAARINPEGLSTSYRLQYGTSTAYGHEFTGNLSAGTEFVAVGYHVQELTPGTTYHYRVVTVNGCIAGKTCTQDGADHTFTTRPGASEFALPDGRAWELVTSANTGGATLELFPDRQAASDGSAITYEAQGETLGENAVSNNSFNRTQVLSRRGPQGWGSQDINGPIQPVKEGQNYSKEILSAGLYYLFSPDLASALYQSQIKGGVLTPDALEGTTYLRDNVTCKPSEPTSCYKPLLSSANTPPGTELERVDPILKLTSPQAQPLAGTPDLAHFILGSPLSLIAGVHEYTPPDINEKYGNLYEWNEGRLQLVSILPNGKTDESNLAQLAGQPGQVARVLSSDGRRVAWAEGNRYGSTFRGLYVRDMVEGKTVHVGGVAAFYQTMSSDGSRVFFLEHGDLYEYHVAPGASYDQGTTTDLTAGHGAGEASAGVQESVSDVSEDGSYVYFVATGVLSSGKSATGEKAASGADNVYVLHNEGGAWEAPKFIATLSSADEHSWSARGHIDSVSGYPQLTGVTSRVSPDGRYLAFMSSRSLTGYDNRDASPEAYEMTIDNLGKPVLVLDAEGKPVHARDEEVFLYHAPQNLAGESGGLICASCDPSGARPHGVLDRGQPLFATGPNSPWGEGQHPHWLAGNLPAWELGGLGDNLYQPRYLSDGGRLFFNSPVGLVPQDTNGLEDVYQFEPVGSGGANGCASASATYRARTGGCVDLISSGQSGSESAFLDASENGNDVFFLSSYRLTAADTDVGYDVWDAHACSASSPCITPPVSPPPCSSGDSCKPAPAPQPELFGAAPSETFSGAGNVAPAPVVAPKPPTRLQQLSKALASCRKRYGHSKKRRAACERTAHKHYGYAARRAHRPKTTKRGGK
jgi:hypothetical protein